MKQCELDRTPCLHAPCLEAEGIACCRECAFSGNCASACFKVKGKLLDKWEQMRVELMRLTMKELKALAKRDGITLGYDASRKDSTVAAIVSARRYQERNGFVPKGYDWHHNGVTKFGGIKS